MSGIHSNDAGTVRTSIPQKSDGFQVRNSFVQHWEKKKLRFKKCLWRRSTSVEDKGRWCFHNSIQFFGTWTKHDRFLTISIQMWLVTVWHFSSCRQSAETWLIFTFTTKTINVYMKGLIHPNPPKNIYICTHKSSVFLNKIDIFHFIWSCLRVQFVVKLYCTIQKGVSVL